MIAIVLIALIVSAAVVGVAFAKIVIDGHSL